MATTPKTSTHNLEDAVESLFEELPAGADLEDSIDESLSEEAQAAHESASAATPSTLSSASMTTVPSSSAPKTSIATITVCFIEDNARSLNGRIYPRAIVDTLIARAQERISSPDGLPVTCFVNHSDADNDQTLLLIGKVTRIWKEGTKGYADIAIADTTAGRDTVALIHGGYLRTESLRASGVTTRLDAKFDLPIVVEAPGDRAELDGIDLTSYPGLQSVARIRQLMLESRETDSQDLTLREVFSLDQHLHILQEEGPRPMTTLPAAKERAPMAHAAAHRKVHDHVAAVLDECLTPKHGNSTNTDAKESTLTEEGRKLAQRLAKPLIEAHDIAAKQCAMECAGCYGGGMDPSEIPDQMPDDGDGDDDFDDLLSLPDNNGGQETMTPEQARALLESQGYAVQAPKTAEEKLQEKLDEQERKFEERLRAIVAQTQIPATLAAVTPPAPAAATPEPQRQTLVEGANTNAQKQNLPPQIYTNGSYLRDPLHPSKWQELLDRTRPLPAGLNPSFALKEMSVFLSARITESMAQAYGILV